MAANRVHDRVQVEKRRGISYRLLLLCFGALGGVSAWAVPPDFWVFVEQAILADPEQLLSSASVEANAAQLESLGWLEDPIVEVGQISRNSSGQNSTVRLLGVRQRLPFWSARSRQKDAQAAVLDSSRFESQDTRNRLESAIVLKLYLYARARQEQHHLRERRVRLKLVKEALSRTKASSPGQRVERSLIASAITLTEEQFDVIDAEVAQRKLELEKLGLPNDSSLVVRWITKRRFEDFRKSLKVSSSGVSGPPGPVTKADPALQSRQALLQAAESELEARKPRPEFDLLAQIDRESGGAQEKNLWVGLGIRIPINGLLGPERKIGQARVEKARAELSSQERTYALNLASIGQEIVLAEKSLTRFAYEKIHDLELAVEKTEREVRQGWVPVAQLLELERQMHAQIEATFDAQIRSVELIQKACRYYACEARNYLGGSL